MKEDLNVNLTRSRDHVSLVKKYGAVTYEYEASEPQLDTELRCL